MMAHINIEAVPIYTWFKAFLRWMGILSGGSNSSSFSLASHLSVGQLLKERICSSGSKFFFSRIDPFMQGLYLPEKLTGSHLKSP